MLKSTSSAYEVQPASKSKTASIKHTVKQTWATESLHSKNSQLGAIEAESNAETEQADFQQWKLIFESLHRTMLQLFTELCESTSVPTPLIWLCLLIEPFQLLGVILSTRAFPWNNDFLNGISSFLSIWSFDNIDKHNTLYFVLAVLCVFTGAALWVFVTLLYAHNTLKADDFIVVTFKRYMMLITGVAYQAILNVLLSAMLCNSADEAVGVCSSGSSDQLTKVLFGSVSAVLLFGQAVGMTMYLYADSFSTHAALAQGHVRVDLLFIVVKTSFVSSGLLLHSDGISLWLPALILVVASFTITYCCIFYPTYYNWIYAQARCVEFSVVCFASICLLICLLENDANDHGPALLFFVGTPLAAVAALLLARQERIAIEKQAVLSTFNNEYQVEMKIRFMLERVDAERKKSAVLKEEESLLQHSSGSSFSSETEGAKSNDSALFQQVDSYFLQAFRLFPDKPFLYVWYSIFCMKFKLNHFMSLRQLQKAGALNPSLDVQFAIFRQRQRLNKFFQQSIVNKDIETYMSFQQHMVSALKYDELTTRTQLIFWDTLLQEHTDMVKLHQISNIISTHLKTALNHYQQLVKLNSKSPQVLRMYASFLIDIANDPQKAAQLLAKAKELEDEQTKRLNEKNENYKANDKMTLFDERNAILILAGDESSLGKITQVNVGASRLFGCQQAELLNTAAEDLLPEPYSSEQRTFLSAYLDMSEMSESCDSAGVCVNMKACSSGSGVEQFVVVKTRSGFISACRVELRKFVINNCTSVSVLALFQSITTDNHYMLVERGTGIISECTAGCPALFRFSLTSLQSRSVYIHQLIADYESKRDECLSETGGKFLWSDKRGSIAEQDLSEGKHELLYELTIWCSQPQQSQLNQLTSRESIQSSKPKSQRTATIDTICIAANLVTEIESECVLPPQRSLTRKSKALVLEPLDREVEFSTLHCTTQPTDYDNKTLYDPMTSPTNLDKIAISQQAGQSLDEANVATGVGVGVRVQRQFILPGENSVNVNELGEVEMGHQQQQRLQHNDSITAVPVVAQNLTTAALAATSSSHSRKKVKRFNSHSHPHSTIKHKGHSASDRALRHNSISHLQQHTDTQHQTHSENDTQLDVTHSFATIHQHDTCFDTQTTKTETESTQQQNDSSSNDNNYNNHNMTDEVSNLQESQVDVFTLQTQTGTTIATDTTTDNAMQQPSVQAKSPSHNRQTIPLLQVNTSICVSPRFTDEIYSPASQSALQLVNVTNQTTTTDNDEESVPLLFQQQQHSLHTGKLPLPLQLSPDTETESQSSFAFNEAPLSLTKKQVNEADLYSPPASARKSVTFAAATATMIQSPPTRGSLAAVSVSTSALDSTTTSPRLHINSAASPVASSLKRSNHEQHQHNRSESQPGFKPNTNDDNVNDNTKTTTSGNETKIRISNRLSHSKSTIAPLPSPQPVKSSVSLQRKAGVVRSGPISIVSSISHKNRYLSLSELTKDAVALKDSANNESAVIRINSAPSQVVLSRPQHDAASDFNLSEDDENKSVLTSNSRLSGTSSASSTKISKKIRQSVLNENKGISRGLKKFKWVFILSILFVCAVSIGIYIATRSLVLQFESNVELVRVAGLRGCYAVQVAQDTLALALMKVNLFDRFKELNYRSRIYNVMFSLFDVDSQLYAQLQYLDAEHYSLYTQPSLSTMELDENGRPFVNQVSLWRASNIFQMHVSMLTSRSIDLWSINDPSYYYIVRNAPFALLDAYDRSTDLYQMMTAKQVQSIGRWSLGLMCAAIAMMLIVIVTVVRPTVYDVEDSKSQVMLIFLDIPPNTVMKAKSLCEKRAATFRQDETEQNLDNTEEASVVRNERHEQQHATQKKRARTSKSTKAASQSDRQKWIFLSKISLIFLLSMAYFIAVYMAGFVRQQLYFETAPAEQNWSVRSRLQIKQSNLMLHYFALQTPSILPIEVYPTYDSIHSYIVSAIQLTDQLVYGNSANQITGIANIEKLGRINNQEDIYFYNGCDYPDALPDCDSYANSMLLNGLYAAKIEYFTMIQKQLYQFNQTILVNGSAAFNNETSYNFLYSTQQQMIDGLDDTYLTNSQAWSNQLLRTALFQTLDQQLMQLSLILLICFNGTAILLYIILYRPLITVLDTQIKRTRSMLLMIPIDVLDSIPAVKAFLAESTTML